LEIEKRYDLYFVEIGTDENHVHFLIQSVPMFKPHQYSQNSQKCNGKRDFPKKATGQENALGRRVLD